MSQAYSFVAPIHEFVLRIIINLSGIILNLNIYLDLPVLNIFKACMYHVLSM